MACEPSASQLQKPLVKTLVGNRTLDRRDMPSRQVKFHDTQRKVDQVSATKDFYQRKSAITETPELVVHVDDQRDLISPAVEIIVLEVTLCERYRWCKIVDRAFRPNPQIVKRGRNSKLVSLLGIASRNAKQKFSTR